MPQNVTHIVKIRIRAQKKWINNIVGFTGNSSEGKLNGTLSLICIVQRVQKMRINLTISALLETGPKNKNLWKR